MGGKKLASRGSIGDFPVTKSEDTGETQTTAASKRKQSGVISLSSDDEDKPTKSTKRKASQSKLAKRRTAKNCSNSISNGEDLNSSDDFL